MGSADHALTADRPVELRHAPLLTIAALLRSAFGLAFSLLAIHAVGASAFGNFSLVWSFCVAFAFMYTGINTVLVASMVQARQSREGGIWVAAAITLTLPIVAATALCSGVAGAMMGADDPLRWPLMLCPLMLGCQLLTLFFCATLEGQGQIRPAVLLPLLSGAQITTGLIAAVFFGFATLDLGALLQLTLAAYGIEAVVAAVYAIRHRSALGPIRLRAQALRKLVVGGAGTQGANLVGFFLDPFSKGVLAVHLGSTAVALFDLSMKVGWALHAAFSAYARLFLQMSATAHDLRIGALRQSARLTWVPALLVSTIGVALLPPLLAHALHLDQAALALGMTLSLCACVLMTIASPAFISLIGFADHGFVFRNQMILAFANVAATLALVPIIGFVGAFAGNLIGTLINVALISRRLRMHMPAFLGLPDLARSFGKRMLIAIALLCGAAVASTHVDLLAASGLVGLAAFLLLLREPLASATWQRFHPRLRQS